MTRAEMLAELLEVLNEAANPTAYSSTTLLRYLAEGQDKFCERTGYFKDKTNFSITLESGTATYDIPDRVIQILDIWDGTRKLKHRQVIDEEDGLDTTYFTPSSPGTPLYWDTADETEVITIYPTPSAAENELVLTLQVWRYSRYDLAGDGATAGVAATPEIPSRFQRAPIEWAAFKALNHHDLDTQDKVKAAEHLGYFNMYVEDGIAARNRIHNREVRTTSNPAYRT